MPQEYAENFQMIIPQIKASIKSLTTKENKRVKWINQVTDPAMTLISNCDTINNPAIKKENLIKVKSYLERVILPQVYFDLTHNEQTYKNIYFEFKNAILNELENIEKTCVKLSTTMDGVAAKFLSEFSNGLLNEPATLKNSFSNLVAILSLKNLLPLQNSYFNTHQDLINTEKKVIIQRFRELNEEIEKNSFKFGFANSTILNDTDFKMINGWLGGDKTFHPIFSSKDHGFSSEVFHNKCDGKGATIVVVESRTGQKFGGYANSSWNKSGKYIADEKCFIFSIDLKERYMHKNGDPYSMFGHPSYGPRFGGGSDIIISNECNKSKNNSRCNPSTYDTRTRTAKDIAGSQFFSVRNYEVFVVNQTLKWTNKTLFVRKINNNKKTQQFYTS